MPLGVVGPPWSQRFGQFDKGLQERVGSKGHILPRRVDARADDNLWRSSGRGLLLMRNYLIWLGHNARGKFRDAVQVPLGVLGQPWRQRLDLPTFQEFRDGTRIS